MPGITQVQDMQHSGDAPFWCRKGTELMNEGDLSGALTVLDDAARKDPDYVPVWEARGRCLGELGDYQGAAASYSKALEIDEFNADSWFNKSIVLEKMGKIPEAEVCAAHAIDLAMGR